MKPYIAWLAAFSSVALGATQALAEDNGWTQSAPPSSAVEYPNTTTPAKVPPPPRDVQAGSAQQAPQPPRSPAPVYDDDETDQTGQWVDTTANGWVWVPTDTQAYDLNGVPSAYLYTPTYGWSWYASPWGAGAFALGAWVGGAWPYGFRVWGPGAYGWGWHGWGWLRRRLWLWAWLGLWARPRRPSS